MPDLLDAPNVPDFDTWKRQTFDRHPAGRAQAARGHRICRLTENPNQAIVELESSSTKLPAPPIIVEETETVTQPVTEAGALNVATGRTHTDSPSRPVRRRDLLAGFGAAGAAALLSGAAQPAVANADAADGAGAYFINIVSSSSSQPMFEGVLALAAGGVAIAVSAAPRGTHLGSWQPTSASGIQFRLIAFEFDSSGNNTGYIQVDASGPTPAASIRATYTVTFVPISGPPQVVDQGTLSGNRLPS